MSLSVNTKKSLSFFIFLITFFSYGQKKTIFIRGKIEIPSAKELVLNFLDTQNNNINDTLRIDNGNFSFKIDNVDSFLNIKFQTNSFAQNLILNPGKVQLTIDRNGKYIISGDGALTEIANNKSSIFKKIRSKEYEIYNLQKIYLKEKNSLKGQQIISKGKGLQDQIFLLYADFVHANPNSYQSLEYLYVLKNIIEVDELEKKYSKLNLTIKNTNLGHTIKDFIKKAKKNSIGSMATDFEKQSVQKNKIKLSDFKGYKNVLLIFWASWCEPCRKETKELLTLYKSLKNTEIIFIGVLDDVIRLNQAISKDGIQDFINICDCIPQNELYKNYSIPAIPFSVLINKDGRIIKKFNGLQTNKLRESLTVFENN